MMTTIMSLTVKAEDTDQLVMLQACFKDIKSLMTLNVLLLNSDKTQVIVFRPKPLRVK